MKDPRNKARLADNLLVETTKALGTAEQKNKELALKLATANRDQKSAEARLKTAEAQVKEQRKKLYYSKIELAMAK